MSLLVSIKNVEKTMGSKLLFDGLSFGINEREKIGLIGPNGGGKSTLLKLISKVDTPDEGEINHRKGLNIAFVTQETVFDEKSRVQDYVVDRLLLTKQFDQMEAEVQAAIYLSIAGFEEPECLILTLSGGWRKRLAIVIAIAQEPELLILDEPTNHMDWDGILWLESWLKTFKKALILVSHDRTFLDNATKRTIEINRLYSDGFLSFDCGYQRFLARKEEYVTAQMNLQENLSNKARREVEWLRAGVKARTTKSQSRINRAYELLDNLEGVKARNSSIKAKSRIEIDSSGKKSKKFIEIKNLDIGYENLALINDLSLTLNPNSCIGILGGNGCGKTSLLKAICQGRDYGQGEIFWADKLKVVYFDQKREALPQDIHLMSFLGDGSDYVIFKGESTHVASYASRFLFDSEKMHLKISQLSGGEQARLLIAKLLLEPADVFILDEPTNDLDIETLDVLESSLQSFGGLVILVSHDRYFLNQLCQRYLALDGQGGWTEYAEISQWLRSRGKSKEKTKGEVKTNAAQKNKSSATISKAANLSYKQKKQLATIEDDIPAAEKYLEEIQTMLSSSEVLGDPKILQQKLTELDLQKKKIDGLYALWELAEKS